MTEPRPTTTRIALQLNGQALLTACGTLAELLAERGYDDTTRAFACAVNRRFVPRAQWGQTPLQPGDAVEVVSPVVGG